MKMTLLDLISSKEDAIKFTNKATKGLIVVSIIEIVLGFIFGGFLHPFVIGGFLYLVLAILLKIYKSRIISVILLLPPLAHIALFIFAKISNQEMVFNGMSIFAFYFAIQGINASFKFHNFVKKNEKS